MAEQDDTGPETPEVEDPDLLELLGPPPSRVISVASRKQVTGRSRINAPAVGMGPGRVPGGKCTPARMWAILGFIEKLPVVTKACRFANIHPATLKLWLEKSTRGQPGDIFDLVINPDDPPEEQITKRFHELYDLALESGVDLVDEAAIQRAIGYEEPLNYQGHATYKSDPVLIDLGYTGSDAWAKDARGRPIPETVFKQDTDLIQFILKNRRANIYGNKQQLDVNVRGGVLVVAAKAASGNDLVEESQTYLKDVIDVEFDEVDDAK